MDSTTRRPKVTSLDVAREAGVSQSSVSRAFSPLAGQGGVSEAKRLHIFATARELGYRPNAIARSLSTARSNIVALLFSYLDNPFYALAMERLCTALQDEGYHALVLMLPDPTQGVEETVARLLDYQVDGVITATVDLTSSLSTFCLRHGIPMVMFNRVFDDDRLSSVSTDNVAGGRLAARHLVETGRERIAMIGGWSPASTSRDREAGFRAGLAEAGVPLFAMADGAFDLARTREGVAGLFDRPVDARPDALFVANDYMAIEAMSALRHRFGLRIPRDVAVIGFDDTPIAALPEFGLTSVRQPMGEMIDATIELMLRQIERADAPPRRTVLAPVLIPRGSTLAGTGTGAKAGEGG